MRLEETPLKLRIYRTHHKRIIRIIAAAGQVRANHSNYFQAETNNDINKKYLSSTPIFRLLRPYVTACKPATTVHPLLLISYPSPYPRLKKIFFGKQ
jgi:hypothetical protein